LLRALAALRGEDVELLDGVHRRQRRPLGKEVDGNGSFGSPLLDDLGGQLVEAAKQFPNVGVPVSGPRSEIRGLTP